MTRHENCRSITRYSLNPSLDQLVVSPNFSTAITNVPCPSAITGSHNTTPPATTVAAFDIEHAGSNLQKSYRV